MSILPPCTADSEVLENKTISHKQKIFPYEIGRANFQRNKKGGMNEILPVAAPRHPKGNGQSQTHWLRFSHKASCLLATEEVDQMQGKFPKLQHLNPS